MKRIIYDISRWSIFQHRDARGLDRLGPDESARLRFEDELFERLYGGDPVPLPDPDRDRTLGVWAQAVHDACTQLPTFSRLADECRGDAAAAAVGVEELLRDVGDTAMGSAPIDRQLRQHLRAGAHRASAAIEDFRSAMVGLEHLAVGMAASPPGGSAPVRERTVELARRLRSDQRLRRVSLMAGRFRRIGANKRRQRVQHGTDEINSIEQGADLGRLLPVELSRLVHPRLRWAARRDLLERRALQYAIQGNDALGRGPLVVLLDKSSSMEGTRDEWASAVALSLLGIAQDENRRFGLVGFNGGIISETLVEPGARLPEAAILHECSGGTAIDRALDHGLGLIENQGGKVRAADIVIVTDGESDTDRAPDLRARARRADVTILVVGIGVSSASLESWGDIVETIGDPVIGGDAVAGAILDRVV